MPLKDFAAADAILIPDVLLFDEWPPTSWPPRPATGLRSIRFHATGTATGNFSDNAFMFAEQTGANTFLPTPYVAPGGEQTQAKLGDLTVTGSPMGAGVGTYDVDPDPRVKVVPPPAPQIWAHSITVTNLAVADLELSFDGTHVHGFVPASTSVTYLHRHESGIAVRGNGTFHIEAW
jgi:hypothetical protein